MKENKIEIKFHIAYQQGSEFKDQLLVTSHERSGTHFLMNSIDSSFKYYSSKKFINFDYLRLGSFVNFHSNKSLEDFFSNLHRNKNVSIFKSHFNASYFENLDKNVLKKIKFIFIYRNLIETMKSFWIFINNVNWNEGPKNNFFSKFCFEKPKGQLIRYDNFIGNNLIERYYYNLKSWIEFSNKHNILLINYNDLNKNYEKTLDKISKYLNLPILEKNKFNRSDYFEINVKGNDNLIYDEENNHKIVDYYKNLLEKKKINNKIFMEII